MSRFLFFFIILTSCNLYTQDKISIKDLYYEGFLAYKDYNDKLFTGSAQKIRKNGHLVYEEIYEKGVLVRSILYYNRIETVPAEEIIYYRKTFTPKTKTTFSLKDSIITYFHYDKNGKKTLKEIYTKDVLSYRCEFVNGKKHGVEFCINEDGSQWKKEYYFGKRVKEN